MKNPKQQHNSICGVSPFKTNTYNYVKTCGVIPRTNSGSFKGLKSEKPITTGLGDIKEKENGKNF